MQLLLLEECSGSLVNINMPIIDYIFFTVYDLLQIQSIQLTIGIIVAFAVAGYLDEFNTKLKRRYKSIAIFWKWFEKFFWFIIVTGAVIYFLLFIYYLWTA